MKNIIAVALIGAVILVDDSYAQSTPPATFAGTNAPQTTFVQDVATWTTSYNLAPDHAWTNQLWQLDTGVATVTGSGISDRIALTRNFGSFQGGIMGQFLGLGSAFDQVQGQFGYCLVEQADFKLVASLGAGYDFAARNGAGSKVGAMVVEPGIYAFKMMTSKTYAGVGYTFPVRSVGKFDANGVITAYTGFTF